MKTYGKEPESLESIVDLFTEVFSETPFTRIADAMKEHAKCSSEFPTPADLFKIMEGWNDREMSNNRPERRIFSPPKSEALKQHNQTQMEAFRKLRENL